MGLLIIISSPSGGGKDAVIRALLKNFPKSAKVITTTSRTPRPSDIEGVTYNFLSREEFKQKIKEGYFLEYNDCVGNYYGTPHEYFYNLLKNNNFVFSNIDVNGKYSIDKLGVRNLSFFLLPESIDVLKKRAEKRGGMTKAMVDDRMRLAKKEIEKSADYDYKIVNYEGKIEQTIEEITQIIRKRQAVYSYP